MENDLEPLELRVEIVDHLHVNDRGAAEFVLQVGKAALVLIEFGANSSKVRLKSERVFCMRDLFCIKRSLGRRA